jgi:hypothetical protein
MQIAEWKETQRQKTKPEAAVLDGPEAFITVNVVSLGLAGGTVGGYVWGLGWR